MTETQNKIESDRFYGICEAAELIHKDRKTLLTWIKNYPKVIPITFSPVNKRKLISGTVLLKLRDNSF